ncbi:MAG: SURF1 family protein [Microbacteriaceae bacterium]|nr:SURF1 family protein [Microbacteriaceae bacterium]
MSVWRLAATKRWIGILGFTLAFAVACVGLGQWQFDRRASAQAAIALLDNNYAIPTASLSEVVETVDDYDASEKWRSVRIIGVYNPEVLYVRTRSGAGGIGFEQLSMLTQSDGTVFVVNRGWVPANGDNSAPAETPSPPAGLVIVTAHLIPGEQQILGRDAPAGQIATIHLATIDELTDGPLFRGWYGRVDTESVSADTGTPWERPVLSEGPHLSYALQWYVFAAMGFFGYGWALRKEHRGDVVPTPRLRKRRSDEDIEDEALDAR